MKTIAIIPAGGSGLRTGTSTPKQFLKFFGKELLVYTLEVFQSSKMIDEIVVAANKSYFGLIDKLITKYTLNKVSKMVEGGNERQDSVFNAVSSLSLNKLDLIAVHDAARPLLSKETLNKAIKTAKEKGNAVVCIKARDTLLNASESRSNYPDRSNIYQIQTPQIFRFGDLKEAFTKAYKQNLIGTDESMLMHNAGHKLHLVEGSLFNFKVTTSEDLVIFKKIMTSLR